MAFSAIASRISASDSSGVGAGTGPGAGSVLGGVSLGDGDVVLPTPPVESELGLPFEFLGVEDRVSYEPINYVSLVDLDYDQGVDFFSGYALRVLLFEIGPDELH